ncbi:MAG: hypothetical protein QOJ65_1924 [Fimbriimonadaceae bacterium]|nr:hypothetical protein [Fimbriimonadaceae bacterium]
MNDLYTKLVDLYAGRELPSEIEAELEAKASQDGKLAHDMLTLRATVDALSSMDDVEFTEESYQRVLMKVYARGVEMQPTSSTPPHLQYYLPIQG